MKIVLTVFALILFGFWSVLSLPIFNVLLYTNAIDSHIYINNREQVVSNRDERKDIEPNRQDCCRHHKEF